MPQLAYDAVADSEERPTLEESPARMVELPVGDSATAVAGARVEHAR